MRELAISIHKVKGERDESKALLRFADTMVGLIREANKETEKYLKIFEKLSKSKIIINLNP